MRGCKHWMITAAVFAAAVSLSSQENLHDGIKVGEREAEEAGKTRTITLMEAPPTVND
ncbi:MAG: hypothetical protein JW808_02760 [Victivallales bacterium]|nr:hypothetical protein [Victivallales bacterium]